MEKTIKKEKINDIRVKPIKGCGATFNKPIRGADYFKFPYANICLLASTNSGKTTAVYNAMKKLVRKGTNVMIFSPTIHNDISFEKMKDMLEKKGCNVLMEPHFISKDGLNFIDEFRANYDKEHEPKEEEEIISTCKYANLYQPDLPEEIAEKKPYNDPMITPETIIIFDDLAKHMRHPSITDFLIKSRHYKTKTFISIHSAPNLMPDSWENIHNVLIFKNQPEARIQELSEKAGLTFPGDKKNKSFLHDLYKEAIEGPKDFLYLQLKPEIESRRNFNIKLNY